MSLPGKNRRVPFLLALCGLCLGSASGSAFPTETELLAIIADEQAPAFKKTVACRELAIVGTELSVAPLAEMLTNESMSHLARYALEPLPSPAVDAAFRNALTQLHGKQLIGVIDSIANRGDTQAIAALASKLGSNDPEVTTAAAHCLARLGTDAAADALGKVDTAQFSDALLLCSKTLADQGLTAKAIKLLTQISSSDGCPGETRNAGALQWIILQKENGLMALRAALTSEDPGVLNMGLRTARLVAPAKATQVVLGVIDSVPSDRTPLFLTLLGDLAEPSCRDRVIAAASSGNADEQIAALQALETLGTAKQVPLLLDLATGSGKSVAKQAQETLKNLKAPGTDQALLNLLGESKDKSVVIHMIGQRRLTEATPQLLEMINGPDQLAVIRALGEVISIEKIRVIGDLLDSDSAEIKGAAQQALHAACQRMPDRSATVRFLSSHLASASEEKVAFVYNELRHVGGEVALGVVAKAAKTGGPLHKNYATKALGQWLDTTAAPVLLDLAKSEAGTKYGIRGLRGYLRLARQFAIRVPVRMEMCRTALDISTRKNEKLLVLEVLERYPNMGSLNIAITARKDPEISTEAEKSAIVIANKVGRMTKDVRTAMDRAGIASPE